MKRRSFIMLIGGAAAISPFTVHSQQAVPTTGFVYAGATSSEPTAFVAAFRQGKEAGFVERQIAVDYCYFAGQDPILTLQAKAVQTKLTAALQQLSLYDSKSEDAYKRLVKVAPENATYQYQLASVAGSLGDKATAREPYGLFSSRRRHEAMTSGVPSAAGSTCRPACLRMPRRPVRRSRPPTPLASRFARP